MSRRAFSFGIDEWLERDVAIKVLTPGTITNESSRRRSDERFLVDDGKAGSRDAGYKICDVIVTMD